LVCVALTPGARIGPYEVAALIGEGGMGKVWRAHHTALNRDDALKVLPEPFASDADRLARFRREAQVLASLNHPNIAHVYGLEQADGVQALVMELVEGETLADRIARGPIPVDEALPIARQIAEALEAAHEQGIVHRDLKPANIKVREDGTVKVLDFGLAKLAGSPVVATANPALSISPTITSPALMSGIGVLLGTAAYMSPEQAKGKPADKRSDLWAFGCVLFEMLTGSRAFEGIDISETLASVLKTEPNWTALPRAVPTPVRTLLALCLEKDRSRRMTDIAIAQFLLSDAAGTLATSREVAPHPQSVLSRPLPWIVAAAFVSGIALWAPWRTTVPSESFRLSTELGADVSLVTDQGAAAVLSPDGTTVAFTARTAESETSQLYVRRLQQLRATVLSGTDGARNPFFSPDGQWIGFFAGGRLKKISVTGSASVTLCDAVNGRGGSWADDGTIVFSPGGASGTALVRVSSAGGTPEPLTKFEPGEVMQRWPQMLPGSKAVLFVSAGQNSWDTANIVVQTVPTGTRTIVQKGGYYARYLPSGHLVYLHEGTLFAAPFDIDRLQVTGQAVPVLEDVTTSAATGGAQFAVGDNGTLLYLPGEGFSQSSPIAWIDASGKISSLRAASSNWAGPEFSPDGRRLAMFIYDGKQSDVWVDDWERDTLSRLTFDASDDTMPKWTPDGRRITFASARADKSTSNIYWQPADGTGEVQRLTESKNNQAPSSWHPSGKFLIFYEANPQTGGDLMILPMEGDEVSGWKPGKPTPFLNSPFSETFATFSPDGRWLAYNSNESGRQEVYVRPFPGPGGKWQISTNGGAYPRWSRKRNEIFFQSPAPENRIMVAPYIVEGNSFNVGKPRLWAERRLMPRLVGWNFDIHPDGERIVIAPDTQETFKQDKVVFIFNFFDELRRRVPAK
jgi:serine/threonine protein kinase